MKPMISLMLVAATAWAQSRTGDARSAGACSAAITGNGNNRVTLICDGVSAQKADELVRIMNGILSRQLDPKAVMKKLDEIKTLAAQGSTSPDSIAKGIQMYATGQELTSKQIAQTAYERLTDFLQGGRAGAQTLKDQQDRMSAAMQQMQQSALSARAERMKGRVVDTYHDVGLYRIVSSTLSTIQSGGVSVDPLVQMNENVKNLDDIRRLADEIKRFPDARSQRTSMELEQFIDSEQRFEARDKRDRTPPANLSAYQQLFPHNYDEKQIVDLYRMACAHQVSGALDQLQSRKIRVDELVAINRNVTSVDDIQKLADAFKSLADRLPPN